MAKLIKIFRSLRFKAFIVLMISSCIGVRGADYFVRGVVRDSVTNQVVPHAMVTFDHGRRGTVADNDGIFEITVPGQGTTLTVRSQGYRNYGLKITKNRVNLYAIYLQPEAVELNEVVVKKRKYSKRNNPAVTLMQHIRRTARNTDPTLKPYYSRGEYSKIALALNNFDLTDKGSLLNKFPFLAEHLDTSAVTGKPILPVSLRQQKSTTYWRRHPEGKHTVVEGKTSDGIDEIVDRESMDKFFNDILGPVDVYARDINLLQNRFVSPLSPIAADFYKFYITDSITDGATGNKFYTLSFYPHNKAAFGFNGTMEVSVTDTTAFVRSVEMRIPSQINLNFIESLYIRQTFKQAADGTRLPVEDNMTIEAVIIPGTQGLYANRTIQYTDHSFEAPQDEISIFKPRAPYTTMHGALHRDSTFWATVNPTGLTPGEAGVGKLMKRLRKVPLFYWGEKIVQVLVTGYIPTSKTDSKFDIGPMNTTVSANPLEGLRLRAGGMTTASLNPHLFTRFYGAYGFKDHRWKYGVELEWSFREKERHSREFPIHSFRLNSSYDVHSPGQHYIFTNPDNVFLSLHRPGIDPMTYLRKNALTYTLETETNFSVKAIIDNSRQTPSPQMDFKTADGAYVNSLDATSAQIELRFAPGEKFYQTASNRFPINLDAPVVQLTHKFAPRGLGNTAPANVTEVYFSKRFWLSAFGFVDVLAKGGHVWSHGTMFDNLFIANTNLSYTIQPESFALTAPMEFVADSYGSTEVTYWANGALLNMVPGLKRLKLREAISIKGFYGHLSRYNDPAVNTGLIIWPGYETTASRLRTPYLEASVGLDNILRCLRVDYVWRLTHRHSPLEGASRHGVRIAFHATF